MATASSPVDILRMPGMSDSPYLVNYFHHEEEENFVYIELDLCHGALELVFLDHTANRSDIQQIRSPRFTRQLAEGIAHLHKMDVVHRDLKPGNVLFKRIDDEVIIPKIADYGISEIVLNEGKMTKTCRGTDGWKAPEINEEREFSKASDVFAFGLLLFYIETGGSHPFAHCGSKAQTDIDNYNPNINALKQIEPTILDLICRCLERNPSDRIASIDILKHAAFESSANALKCLRDATEVFKVHRKFPSENAFLRKLIFNEKWTETLEPEVLAEVKIGLGNRPKKFTAQMEESIFELLNLIRNKDAHYHETSPGARGIFGKHPDEYFEYWRGKFPHLYIRTWTVYKQLASSTLQTRIDAALEADFNSNESL